MKQNATVLSPFTAEEVLSAVDEAGLVPHSCEDSVLLLLVKYFRDNQDSNPEASTAICVLGMEIARRIIINREKGLLT